MWEGSGLRDALLGKVGIYDDYENYSDIAPKFQDYPYDRIWNYIDKLSVLCYTKTYLPVLYCECILLMTNLVRLWSCNLENKLSYADSLNFDTFYCTR